MVTRSSGIYLITQTSERTRKLQSVLLSLMRQLMMNMKYRPMTVFFQGQHFNLILHQSYFDSEHVGSQLWLMMRRCSSRSKLTKKTRTLYDIYGGN